MEIIFPSLNAPFTCIEVKAALARLKDGKTPGVDSIPNEVWKNLSDAGTSYMVKLFNMVLERGQVPEEWGRVLLRMIPKHRT